MNLVHDQRPFYVTYSDSSVQAIKDLLNFQKADFVNCTRFTNIPLPEELGKKLVDLVPFGADLRLSTDRVSVFITPPRTYYRAHKDGFDLRAGLNYPIYIADDRSITRWYDEAIAEKYRIESGGKKSREAVGFNPLANKPVCEYTMKPDEAVIFNVDRFHDFHNKSDQHRVILTFRPKTPDVTFDMVIQKFSSTLQL